MARATRAAFLLILSTLTAAAFAGEGDSALTLAGGECRAPFNLVVPAEALGAAEGLSVIIHADGEDQGLIFEIAPGTVTVRLRTEAGTTQLKREEAALPGDLEQVVLKRRPDGVAVSYDARTVLRAAADLPDGGRWGVRGEPEVLDQIMLQPVGRVMFGDDFMRTSDQPSTWQHISGKWRVAQLESARFSANAFTLLGSVPGGGEGLTTAGYWFWEDLTVEASIRPPADADGYGVALACQPEGSGYVLRFMPDRGAAGTLQLVRVMNGREQVLDRARAVVHPDEWHRLALSGIRGRLEGALDGAALVGAEAPALGHGQIGLWVSGDPEVAFDDVEAHSGPLRGDEPVVLSHQVQTSDPAARAFINDRYMQEWADERDQWQRGSGGTWHSGYFFDDVELSWEMTQRGLPDEAGLHICVPAGGETLSPPEDASAGCHLDLQMADGKLLLTLREGEQVRAEQHVPAPELPAMVALRRRGDVVEAVLADRVIADFEAEIPAAGKVGLTGAKAARQAARLRITSRNVIDSAFREAPTDWHVGSGDWGVSSRWDCTPRWSWFQGRSDELASVWTRRHFTGDVVVEFFAGISMDQPWAPFYQHPGNLCVTLCGSNATPGSGYSLVVGGWGNSAAGIFRRGDLVAKVPGFTMPDILDSLGGTTGREDAHKLHNEWWHIRAERVDGTVRLLVDGKLAATFEDPEALSTGSVGIWTLDQAMSVARARVYYEQAEHVPPAVRDHATVDPAPELPVPRFGPPHIASTFEHGTGGWQPAAENACDVALVGRDDMEAGRCLRALNPAAGGTFALRAPFAEIDLREHPLLAFDYAVPEDVRIDLFATVRGRRYRLAFTGTRGPVEDFEDAGTVPEVRVDGRWHTASVDLLGLLRPFFPDEEAILLERLEFAARAVPEYTRAGIGGNPAGASWRLDDVYLGGVTSDAVEVETPRDVRVEAPGCVVDRDIHMGRARHRLAPRRSGLTRVRFEAGARTGTDLIAFDLGEQNTANGQAAAQIPAGDSGGAEKPSPEDGLPAPLLSCDFEEDIGPIEPWGVDAAVDLHRVRDPAALNPDGGQWCLQARCTELGGLFGVALDCVPFEASRFPVLEFDYRATDELRVDLIVAVEGRRRVVKFTDNDHTWRPIGSVEATPDGQWHHASVNLRAMLAKAFGREAPLPVSDLAFATSGWPGNREDTRWWLENVQLRPVATSGAQEDTRPPIVTDLSPPDGASACPDTIAATLADDGSGISPADIRLTVNERTWTVADEALAWDAKAGRLTWHLPAGASPGEDGSEVRCRLEAGDLVGNALEPVRWAFTLDHSLDETAPQAPVVSYLPARAADSNDFEADTGGWGNFVDGQVLRRAEGGASGPGCAELRHLGSRGRGFVLVRDFGEGWREFPMIRFRCRAVNVPRTQVQVLGTTFDGTKDRWTPLGSVQCTSDGWQTAVLNVADALARTSATLDIHRIFLSIDLPPDVALLVDDYAMYSRAATTARFQWTPPSDPSGIAGYSWVLDAADDTVPPEQISGSDIRAEFADLAPGHYCFHLRACDRAGNWGPAAHVPFDLTGDG